MKLIFDLGMHNGNDTEFYLAKGFRVIAVDASPTLCNSARSRFYAAQVGLHIPFQRLSGTKYGWGMEDRIV